MRDLLQTDRLILRAIRLSDAPAFSKLGGEYDIVKMTGTMPYPFPPLSAEFKLMYLMAQNRRGLAYPYAITENGQDLIGVADIFRKSADRDFELGYWIGRDFWGKGYVKEAMKALMEEAADSLNISTFVASTWHDNPGSMRVLEKLGFSSTGPNGSYFCMARLHRVESVGFALDNIANLRETKQTAMKALT